MSGPLHDDLFRAPSPEAQAEYKSTLSSTEYRTNSSSSEYKTTPSSPIRGRKMSQPATTLSPSLKAYFHGRRRARMLAKDLPVEKGPSGMGMYTPAGLIFFLTKLTVPLAYLYIGAYVIRDLAIKTNRLETIYCIPVLRVVLARIEHFPMVVHSWCMLEAVFYVCLRLHIQWLQYKCPLEAALASAPMAELEERQELLERILECEDSNPTAFIEGWFFDAPIDSISRYDMLDFMSWCLYEGRRQEHLTEAEIDQLHDLLRLLEYRISIYKYGFKKGQTVVDSTGILPPESLSCDSTVDTDGVSEAWSYDEHCEKRFKQGPEPAKAFRFHVNDMGSTSTFFTSLFESSKTMYETVLDNERVQDIRNFVQNKRQQMASAEESAIATAQEMYQTVSNMSEERMALIRQFLSEMRQHVVSAEESALSMASTMYNSVYFTFIEKGGSLDKNLHAFRHVTAAQLDQTWHSVKERSGSPEFLANRVKQLKQQLRNYRRLLNGMRNRSSTYSAKQMADLLNKISRTNDALWDAESIARNAFLRASGFAKQIMPTNPISQQSHQSQQPLPYAKYSFDSIFDVAIYPLGFHLMILFFTEGCLRVIMHRKGFQRRVVGQTAYYFHPGIHKHGRAAPVNMTPIVFCHGIGIGLIYYLPLIGYLLAQGRPLMLPELTFVTAFRTWQSPNSVLTPQAVASTLTSMLYENGFERATFVGHSYGSAWLSYMCKLAPNVVSALVFLDPICFCLHLPFLTKQFVYQRADPGSTSYFVRTDVNVNWAIQRAFPWTRVALFVEQLPPNIKVAVFLSERDTLVPTSHIRNYLTRKGALHREYPEGCHSQYYASGDITITTFNNVGHGDWAENSDMVLAVSHAVDTLCIQVDELK